MRRPPLLAPLAIVLAALALGSIAHAQDDGQDDVDVDEDQGSVEGDGTGDEQDEDGDVGSVTGGDDAPPVTLPLVPVPVGCTAPTLPHIVFVGEVVDRDFRSTRYEIERIRSGRSAPFASGDLIDVRYGLDAQYLDDGERYLVSAVVHPDLGLLVSRVTPPIEHFGGDEVIGVSETDVDCPDYEDPMRTLHVDGTEIEAGVLDPFLDAKVRIAGAFLIPVAVALGVVFLVAMFRLSIAGLYHSVTAGRQRAT